jgi:HK97 family phage prohead protease
MLIERRAALEVRAAGRRLTGVAAPFDQEVYIGGFTEVVRRGAFTATLADGHDILGLVDHDHTKLLGRTRNSTLRLQETDRGLEFEVDVPDTTLGRDVLAQAERGDLGGASFAFTVRKAGESWAGTTRELRSLELYEVSVVSAWPAYSATEVHARSRPPRLLLQAQRYLKTCL